MKDFIVYEEEGYRVMLEITKDDGTGSTWEYSCFYQEDKDCLAPISSSRINFTTDLTGFPVKRHMMEMKKRVPSSPSTRTAS